MEIWLAILNHDEPVISVIGAYSTEERAEEVAQLASPDDWETLQFVVDEIPYWVGKTDEELEKAHLEAMEIAQLRNQSPADGDPQPEQEDERGAG